MDAYQKFKNEITEILEEIDTFMWLIDVRRNPDNTLKSAIELYEDNSERMKQAFDDLKNVEGDKLIRDIDYEGSLRDTN